MNIIETPSDMTLVAWQAHRAALVAQSGEVLAFDAELKLADDMIARLSGDPEADNLPDTASDDLKRALGPLRFE